MGVVIGNIILLKYNYRKNGSNFQRKYFQKNFWKLLNTFKNKEEWNPRWFFTIIIPELRWLKIGYIKNQSAGPNEFFQNLLLSVSSVKYRFKHWFSFFALVKFNRYLTDPYRYIIDCYCFHNLFLIDFYQ